MPLERDPNLPESAYHVARNTTAPKKKSAKPEAAVLKACIAYLEDCGCYVLRTSSALATFGERKMQVGRVGCADLTLCTPDGRYVACEVKSATGTPTPEQLRQQRFVQRRGGISLIVHSKAELRAALIAAFGAATVACWEATDWRAMWRENGA